VAQDTGQLLEEEQVEEDEANHPEMKINLSSQTSRATIRKFATKLVFWPYDVFFIKQMLENPEDFLILVLLPSLIGFKSCK